jgi:hypothetical protein
MVRLSTKPVISVILRGRHVAFPSTIFNIVSEECAAHGQVSTGKNELINGGKVHIKCFQHVKSIANHIWKILNLPWIIKLMRTAQISNSQVKLYFDVLNC